MIDIIRFDDKVKLQVTQLKKGDVRITIYYFLCSLLVDSRKTLYPRMHSIERSQVPGMQNVNTTDF